MTKRKELSAEQQTALAAFAEKYGRGWKRELLNRWLDGRDCQEPHGALLRQIRNQFGPTWLQRY